MRIRAGDITPKRVYDALQRRLEDIPDKRAWTHSPLGVQNRAGLEKFRDIHKRERCFLMANGPSLGRMDLSPIKDEITIGLNRIYLIFDQLGFQPTYYAASNELIIEQFHEDIRKLEMPKFIGWHRREYLLDDKDVLPENTCFLRDKLSLEDTFSKDVTKGITSGGTVTYHMLQLAYFMGIQEVVLIGLDHNFKEQGTPNKMEVRTGTDENHFHPDYWPKGSKWQLPDLYRTNIAYANARKAFEADGRKIIDATPGGKCEIFEKTDFASVLNTSGSGKEL